MSKLLIFILAEMVEHLEMERDRGARRRDRLRSQMSASDKHDYELGSATMQSAFAAGTARKLRKLIEALEEEGR